MWVITHPWRYPITYRGSGGKGCESVCVFVWVGKAHFITLTIIYIIYSETYISSHKISIKLDLRYTWMNIIL